MLLIYNGSVQIYFIGLNVCSNKHQDGEKSKINCVDGTVDLLWFVCVNDVDISFI